MKLYITRHGETLRNAEQRVLGRTDEPLSSKGKMQAAKRDCFKRYPNGESYFDMAYRIYDFLFMLKREYGDKRVLVVSHGGVCRIICNYFYDMENEEFVTHAFPNCGLEEFEL